MISDLPCIIHGYVFHKLIGKGGFSSVYLVQSERFMMEFCAKVMQIPNSESTEEGEKAAINEMNTLISLNHPHILRLYDHFRDNSRFYLIIEYCPGGSLSNEVVRDKGLSIDRFLYLSRQVISALATCHQHNIAHHDLKLGNVLMDEFGRAKLADFGISIHTEHFGDLCESYSGSIEYEAPEILIKKPHDPFAADIWALGVLFAHMISGSSPWHCDTIGKLKKCIMKGVYRLPKSCPVEISDIIAKMIVIEPEKRITMRQLKNIPLFQMNEIPFEISLSDYNETHPADCLSPAGRQISSLGENPPPDNNESDVTTSLSIIEDTTLSYKTSTTLTICRLNLIKGRSIVPLLRSRYHAKPTFSFQIE